MEIRLDILRAIALGDDSPTRIMYRANLCWATLGDLLADLEVRCMVESKMEGNRRRYSLTEKGQRAMAAFHTFQSEMGIESALTR